LQPRLERLKASIAVSDDKTAAKKPQIIATLKRRDVGHENSYAGRGLQPRLERLKASIAVSDDKTAAKKPQIIATLKRRDVGHEKHVPDLAYSLGCFGCK